MRCSSYIQHRIACSAPSGVEPAARICYNVSLTPDAGRIALGLDQQGCKHPQDYIAITEDALVEIALHGDQLFFSRALDGITTKEELGFFYGGIEYDGYDEKLDRYRVLRFVARFNRGGKVGTVHAFNLNVDFLADEDRDGPKWIGLTIDPDIRNPPPVDPPSPDP